MHNALKGMTLVGALGVLLAFFYAGAERFWANWLLWFLFLFTMGLGALFLVALEHLVVARWSVPIRRLGERVGTLVLVSAPLAIVALGALPVLYPGTRPEALQNKFLKGKAFWLGTPFFSVRTLICVALTLLGTWILVGGSLRQDKSRDPQYNVRIRKFAPVFMAIFALVITCVGWDWIKGLTPEWFSDIFSVYVFAGAFLAGLAAITLNLSYLQGQGRMGEVNGNHTFNLGGFLFAFTVFWSYIGFAQYMLMWYANLPEEIVWYKVRLAGSWWYLTIALALLHFVIPFFALVTREAKANPVRLRWVALLMLGAHLLDLYWLVFPRIGAPHLGWPELSFAAAFLGLGLLWMRGAQSKGADMPVGDPFLKEGLEFRL